MLISELTQTQREELGRVIRARMEYEGFKQAYVAAVLDINERVLRNILAGRSLNEPRIRKLSELLKEDLVARVVAPDTPSAPKDDHIKTFGGYPRHAVERYFGDYIAVRHGLGENPNLHCSYFSFDWDAEKQAMHFAEDNRFLGSGARVRDYSQGGYVHISPDIGLLHLMTCWRGAVRLITLSKLRLNSGMMHGALLTQSDRKLGFMPATTPIVFRKIDDGEEIEGLPECGPIQPAHPQYATWLEELDVVEADYVIAKSGQSFGSGDVVRLKPGAQR